MKILAVEDDKRILEALKKGLERNGFAVDTAADGGRGYAMAATQGYDAIVLDLMLPGMSGEKVCAKLREEGKATPILMLTAKGGVEDRVSGLNCGADDYLTKPFDFSELIARLRALGRRPQQALPPVVFSGDLKLFPAEMKVTKSGREVPTTAKEFALLEYMARNKGMLLTKQRLIKGVWDFDADILPNTVEAFVKSLRKKLGRPERIRTIRGKGYVFE